MVNMYVRHTVADFAKWKVVFEEGEPSRVKYGSSGSHVFQNISNPNEVLVITEWDNKEQGIKFGASAELKNSLQKAGVLGKSEMNFAS